MIRPFLYTDNTGRSIFPNIRVPMGDTARPNPSPAVVTIGADGQPYVNGMPLPQVPSNAAAQANVIVSQPVYQPGLYGDAFQIVIAFAVAGNTVALQRPRNKRVLLLIQNLLAANPIGYTFDRPADATTCIQIPAGGNRLFDSVVPQGNVNIFAPAVGTVIIEYMNVDIAGAAAST